MPNLTINQREILSECRIATVATISPEGFPHLTSVWFVFEQDRFFLSIPSSSAKMRHLQLNPNISILVDTRETYSESGISAQGEGEIISGEEARKIGKRVHAKYIQPGAMEDQAIGGFFESMDDIAISLTPTKWIFWDMAELDQQVFSGALKGKNSLFKVVP